MINPATFIGKPHNFKNKFYIYPPTISDVVSRAGFSQMHKALTVSEDDIRDDFAKRKIYTNLPTPFEFLLVNCYHYPQVAQITKEAFELFIHEEITILYEEKMIIIGKLEQVVTNLQSIDDLVTLTEADFFDFQNKIREACGEAPLKPPEPVDPNENPKIARMKAKARERDRIKARKGVSGGISLATSITAICCMGIGLTPLNIGEMSYAAISPMMKMLQDKEKYEVDIQSLLAGADSKKVKPKYWIRNSDEK